MRRKPYREQMLKARSDVLIEEPYKYKGQWKSSLQCKILHIEIGSGKGDYWQKMATMYPDIGWVAIEKNLNIAAIALKKTPVEPLSNARFIAKDGKDIKEWFTDGEIDAIHLNFVDPWPKKAHEKRRLTHLSFLAVYKELLSKNGQIIMKSDNYDLMAYSRRNFKEYGYLLTESSDDFRNKNHPKDAISEYEAKFIELGQCIYRSVWEVVK